MRLIDAEALYEAMEVLGKDGGYSKVLQIIANAPAIEIGEVAELREHINVLREALKRALEDLVPHHTKASTYKSVNEALASTPAQSLQEHDNEVIERVVTLLKDSAWGDGIIDMRVDDLIEEVRKLKEDEFPYSANLDIYNSVRFADAPYGTMIMESKIVKWLCRNRAKDYFDKMVEGK